MGHGFDSFGVVSPVQAVSISGRRSVANPFCIEYSVWSVDMMIVYSVSIC